MADDRQDVQQALKELQQEAQKQKDDKLPWPTTRRGWGLLSLAVVCGPGAIIIPLLLIYFIGSAASVGVWVALKTEWRDGLSILAILYPIFWAFGLLGIAIITVDHLVPGNAKRFRKLSSTGFVIFLFSVVPINVLISGWTESKKNYHPVDDVDKSLASGKEAIEKQRAAVAKLSDSARELLAGLDKTESELAAAKEQVTQTLTKLSSQQDAVREANTELNGLLQKQREAQLQHQEIDSKLGDVFMQTKAEARRSAWVGWIVAFLMGCCVNVFTGWGMERVKKLRRKGAPPTESPTEPPPPTSAPPAA